MSTTPKLTIRLFGTPEILLEGTPIQPLQPKRQALLFYLAATGQKHLRSSVASLFWSELSDKSALTNLRKPVQQFGELFPHHFHADNQSIHLKGTTNLWVDVGEFDQKVAAYESTGDIEELREAVNLYTDDFLAGFYVRNTPEFESWQTSQRATLREMMIHALQNLNHHATSTNDLSAAIQCVQRIVTMEPWREETHLKLMQLLVQNDQRQDALRQYEVCREALQNEMDAEPGEEIEAFYSGLKPGAKGGISQPRSLVTTTDYTLMGRDAEWRTLRTCWRRLSQPHFVCIAGESGIGKTRLAEELLMLAEQEGLYAVRTRSHALEGRLAYGPVADWLRAEPLKSGLAKLDPIWLTEVARILPELLIEHPDLPHPEPIKDKWQHKRLFEALAHAFTQTQRKMLLVLDDLQWCDSDTLEWLQYLLESADNRFLVVGTVRPEEINDEHPLHRIRQQLDRLDRSTYLLLSQLSQEATLSLAEQVAHQTIDEHLSDQVVADTAGNPLFVIESMRMMENSGEEVAVTEADDLASMDERVRTMPPKMYSVIQSRLSRLSPEAIQVMQIGATIGRAFDLDLLARATEMSTESVLTALDELWQQRVVREVDSVYFDFNHDRIRDVAYEEIRPIKRRLLHGRIVNSIETRHTNDLNMHFGDLADHSLRAGNLERALSYYENAANVAKQIFAHTQVVVYRQKALLIVQKLTQTTESQQQYIDLLLDLGQDLIMTAGWGSHPVGDSLRQAHDQAIVYGTPSQQFRVMGSLARYYRHRGEWSQSHYYAIKSLPQVKDDHEPRLICSVYFSIASALLHQGNLPESYSHFEQAQYWAKKAVDAPHLLVDCFFRIGSCLWLLGFAEQARMCGEKAIQMERQNNHNRLPMVLNHYLMMLIYCRDMAAVEHVANQQVASAAEQDDSYHYLSGRMYQSWCLSHAMGSEDEVDQISNIIESFHETGARMYDPFWQSLLTESLVCTGEIELASKMVHDALNDASESGNRYWDAHLLKQLGDYQLLLRKPDNMVESTYQQAIDTARAQGAKLLELRATVSLCRLWQTQDKIAEAHQLLAPIYGWFTEGFDTVDLKEAKALLDELAVQMRYNSPPCSVT